MKKTKKTPIAKIQKKPRRNLIDQGKEKALVAAHACDEKKAEDIVVLDVRKVTDIADFFVICTITNPRQASAIVDAVDEEFTKKKWRIRSINGLPEGEWGLIDCGDIVLHIFTEEKRNFYRLEDLWSNANQIPLSETKKSENLVKTRK